MYLRSVCFSLFASLATLLSAGDNDVLVFSNSNGDVGGAIVRAVVPEAVRRMGYSSEIVFNPAERSLQVADAGIVDGEGMRVRGLSEIYPNLVETGETIFEMEFTAFTHNSGARVNDWAELEGLRVGYIRGWKIVERNAENFGQAVPVETAPQIFAMLSQNRIDAGIFTKLGGEFLISLNDIKGIQAGDKPLASQELVMYLHKSHAELAPAFDAALQSMKDDGTYDKLVEVATGQ